MFRRATHGTCNDHLAAMTTRMRADRLLARARTVRQPRQGPGRDRGRAGDGRRRPVRRASDMVARRCRAAVRARPSLGVARGREACRRARPTSVSIRGGRYRPRCRRLDRRVHRRAARARRRGASMRSMSGATSSTPRCGRARGRLAGSNRHPQSRPAPGARGARASSSSTSASSRSGSSCPHALALAEPRGATGGADQAAVRGRPRSTSRRASCVTRWCRSICARTSRISSASSAGAVARRDESPIVGRRRKPRVPDRGDTP